MLSRTHHTNLSIGQRAVAQRRLRRSASNRNLFCSTNGCTTFMDVDPSGAFATCHICGSQRRLRRATDPSGRPH